MTLTLNGESYKQLTDKKPYHWYSGRLVVERSLSPTEALELSKEIIHKLDPQGEIE